MSKSQPPKTAEPQKDYLPLIGAIALLGLLAGFIFGYTDSDNAALYSLITALIVAVFSLLGVTIEFKSLLENKLFSIDPPTVSTTGWSIAAFCILLAVGYSFGDKELFRNGLFKPTNNYWVKEWQDSTATAETNLSNWITQVDTLKSKGYSDEEIKILTKNYLKKK